MLKFNEKSLMVSLYYNLTVTYLTISMIILWYSTADDVNYYCIVGNVILMIMIPTIVLFDDNMILMIMLPTIVLFDDNMILMIMLPTIV